MERARTQRREREKQLSASRGALLSASDELAEVVVQPSAWSAELRSCSRLYQPVAVGEVSYDAKDLQAEVLAEVRSPFAFLSHFCIWITIICIRDGNGPGRPRAGPGRAGPENPRPRASRAKPGLKIFYLKVLCATENPNFC